MSLAQKFQEGGQTPTLYNFYGKQYDYNDLAQVADQGLNNYLATLKRGEKDSQDFKTAYTNIMEGIRDGSITFDNGQFYDSKGRYTNSDKKNKDYYGLIANYIYNQMGKSKEYQAPQDKSKIKWDDNSIRTALMRQLYNSDNEYLQDFLDLDEQKDGVRSIKNRSAYLADALQNIINNWDTTFSDYQDSDKAKYTELLLNASKALRDGTINPGDYLALSKAVGGMDFRAMLATGTPTQQVSQQSTQEIVQPSIRTRSASLSDNSYSSDDLSQITSVMTQVPTRGLINILRNSFYNRNYRFGTDQRISRLFGRSDISSKAGITATLNALGTQGVLKPADPNNPNLYYIPGLRTKNGTGWVWDKANNTVTEMPIQNIPYAKQYFTQYIQSNKNGGILKAQTGVKLSSDHNWYSDIFQKNLSHILEGLGKDSNYASWLNDMQDKHGEIYRLASANNNDFRTNTFSYNEPIIRAYQDAYKDGFNNEWNGDGKGYNQLGIQNAQNLGRYDISGRTRTSGDWGSSNWTSDNLFSSITDDRRLLGRKGDFTDEQLQSVIQSFKDKGYDFVEDANGYYKLRPIENTSQQETTTSINTPQSAGSQIQRTQESSNTKKSTDISKALQNIAPYMVGAGRMLHSIHTNNKIADIMKKATKPVLKDTYELYSPVTGAFSEMQLRNRQAADVRRQAAQPYTSDASLNAARALEANRQATELQYQGFLADDKEILRTMQEAKKRQEDNIARRSDVANFNRASINQTNRELAQIEAERRKSNWQSIDNFTSGIESDLKEQANYNKLQNRTKEENARTTNLAYDMKPFQDQMSYEQSLLQKYYNRQLEDLQVQLQRKIDEYHQTHNDDNYTNTSWYNDYVTQARQIQDKQLKDSYDMNQYHNNWIRSVYNNIYNNAYSDNRTSDPFGNFDTTNYQNQNWYRVIKGLA